MKNHLALFAALIVACTGQGPGTDTGTEGTGDCEDFYEGPVSIDQVSVDCEGSRVTFGAETVGWTDGGYVFSQETGNQEPQWSDEHDLESVEYDECGAWDRLEQTIRDGSTLSDPLNDWARNESSVFRCGAHYGDSNVMTYAFVVKDVDGEVASCVVFGDDPQGLISGRYERVNEPTFDTSRCTTDIGDVDVKD